MKKKIYVSRKQFLTMACSASAALAFRDPVQMVLRSLVDGIIRKAQADTQTAVPKNYIYLYLPYGAPRWYFDLLLKTSASDPTFIPIAGVTSTQTNGVLGYQTFTYKGYQLPTLWQNNIPTKSGSWIPMTTILNNFLSMRGIDMLSDGHQLNALKVLQPVPGGPSIDGMVADRSARTVPAVGWNGTVVNQAFKSTSGVGQGTFNQSSNVLDPTNNFHSLLGAFDAKNDNSPPSIPNGQDGSALFSSSAINRRQAMESAMQQGLASLAAFANSSQPGASTLFSMRSAAELLMQQGIGDLSAAYSDLYTKYSNLIAMCATATRTGVNDTPMLVNSVSSPIATSQVPEMDNLQLTMGGNVNQATSGSTDLSKIINSGTVISDMATGFAIAEYMIGKGYSSATSVWTGLPNGVDGTAWGVSPFQWTLDEHSGGAAPSLQINSFYYQALAACLNELITQFQGAGGYGNIWNETLIHIGSEFSRGPAIDGSGSGHGFNANNISLLSGAIKGPQFIGNIMSNGISPTIGQVSSSWGSAAPTKLDGGVQLMPGHIASTVSAILGVNSPSYFSSAVEVDETGQIITPIIGFENS